MKFAKIENKGRARLFENACLEFFTKAHPMVIWGLYTPLIFCSLYYSALLSQLGFWPTLLLFVAGILSWTFFEYFMHRWAFHWISDHAKIQKIIYLFHGNHHHYPRDKGRLFMPPLPNFIFSSVLFFSIQALIGESVFAFFPGFMLGYLLYGSMHYAIHAWNPLFLWMKPLWRNHLLHHYKDEQKGFGVSSTLWDHLLGTSFDLKNEKEDQEKEKALKF